jgi:hypothetical protein
MRTGAGLTVVAIGAILAFAVTGSPSVFNIQIAGWVIMLAGVVSMVLRWRGYRELLRRRRQRSIVVEHPPEPRALGPGQVLHLPPGAGAPLADARPPAAGAAGSPTVEGTAGHAEEPTTDA